MHHSCWAHISLDPRGFGFLASTVDCVEGQLLNPSSVTETKNCGPTAHPKEPPEEVAEAADLSPGNSPGREGLAIVRSLASVGYGFFCCRLPVLAGK